MKKFVLLVATVFLVFGCANKAAVSPAAMDSKLASKIGSDTAAERLAQMDDTDFYLYKIDTGDGEGYIFFNGQYVTADFTDIDNESSKAEDMLFDLMSYELDTNGVSLAYGEAGAENIIIEITDYECPYCRRAQLYLDEKLQGRDDVAVYIVHLPLKVHDNAEISARIFESGLLMGYNFNGDLATDSAVLEYTSDELAEYFATKTADANKFRALLFSDEVNEKLQTSKGLTDMHEFKNTPSFVINGKRIVGFNTRLIDRALGF